ncbi:OLC1v1024061C3 [Oldenlandia corymbosa var. corymbosa]|uniref:OLC1v1024061C3 n=1 Tax=Oldenlandia corymbosa var. corymbosa TaxID=529605 RepID=A0AAV1C4X9_OLDCO|nr:OLC1v1024061C3 [Oldenlandia corymbosa var. corymbosa]
MASFKIINHFHILSSAQPTKPNSSSSLLHPPSQLLFNKNSILNANILSKNTRHVLHLWPIKAVVEEDKDIVTKAESSDKDEQTEEGKISQGEEVEEGKLSSEVLSDSDRLINAAIVLGAGTLAITKLLSIDHDYWHGWTLFEILRYAPEHNWDAYEEALKSNPILSKMVISGIVYSLGDWIAQCYEGKPLFEFDRKRMLRSGIVGFSLHGSLSHYYYQFCEALFPFKGWWVVPAKVAFDQTIWAAVWNSIYYVVLGFLRFEPPVRIFNELKSTFWPMLTVSCLFSMFFSVRTSFGPSTFGLFNVEL